MTEEFPLYIIALCSMLIAIGVFVNLVLLVSVRAGLKRRDLARREFHKNIGARVYRIERHLVMKARASAPLSVEKGGTSRKRIPDSRFQIPNDGRRENQAAPAR